jgi:hypothetical protein
MNIFERGLQYVDSDLPGGRCHQSRTDAFFGRRTHIFAELLVHCVS